MTLAGPTRRTPDLALTRRVLDTGEAGPDRTGTALFAPLALRFTLADHTLPFFTTKHTFLRGVVEDPLWLWDGNGSRREGDGLQWRHYGAKYTDANANYTGQGVGKLEE
ncbi:YOR074Cp-like protein [Ephemerocybe angulata]|uniref:YOR074Cp-like protein n=1 Tax=Ephemerocybe angulata TaxID=980116 RepID=A0A8H6HPM8_9AGAR|nr:YOR074Cp-like protein [Tulosesus angulatus]